MNTLTGLMINGSFLGTYVLFLILLIILTFIMLIRSKGFLNALVMTIVVATFTGIGFMIGSWLKTATWMVVLSFLSYLGSLKLTIFMIKLQSNKLAVVKHSLGNGDEGMSNIDFDDSDFEE